MSAPKTRNGLQSTMAFLVVLAVGAFPAATAPAAILRVSALAVPGGDGTSWASAFRSLQDALAAATSGDEIWLAKGSYTPDDGESQSKGNLEAAFDMRTGVEIYGGFSGEGHETARGERDPAAHRTILSGDLAGDDYVPLIFEDTDSIRGLNAHSVVRCIGVEGAILDGLTVIGGSGAGGGSSVGGGMLVRDASPVVREVRFIGNRTDFGGGISIRDGTPRFEKCEFIGNEAYYSGGGIYVASGGAPLIVDCELRENKAGFVGGGLLLTTSSDATLVNCSIRRNEADAGGAIYFARCDGTMTGCALYFNGGGDIGKSVYITDASPMIMNCTFAGSVSIAHRGTAAVTYTNCILSGVAEYDRVGVAIIEGGQATFRRSIVRGSGGSAQWDATFGTDGGDNLDADPKFYLPLAWDYDGAVADLRIAFGSAAIDAGIPAPDTPATDLRGDLRLVGGGIDLGAYEFQLAEAADDDHDGLSNDFESAHTFPASVTALEAEEDPDRDGLANLMEFALGRHPLRFDAEPPVTWELSYYDEEESGGGTVRYTFIAASYTRSLAAEPYLLLKAEVSSGLGAMNSEWGPAYLSPGRQLLPDGRETVPFSMDSPSYQAEYFARLRVSSR